VDNECVSAERTMIIKQGACPAPVNPSSNGVVPLALMGELDFAADTAAPSSLELRRCDGVGGSVAPIANTIKAKDINHPIDGGVGCDSCACNPDQSSDGIKDLQMKFKTSDLIAALDLGSQDGVAVLELSGVLADGTPFCAHDCVVVMPAGAVSPANAAVHSSTASAFVEVTPLDLNIDSDGFTNFGRSYYPGTAMTLTAPYRSDGQRFVRWSVDGVLQPAGLRTISVMITAETNIEAVYDHALTITPGGPPAGL